MCPTTGKIDRESDAPATPRVSHTSPVSSSDKPLEAITKLQERVNGMDEKSKSRLQESAPAINAVGLQYVPVPQYPMYPSYNPPPHVGHTANMGNSQYSQQSLPNFPQQFFPPGFQPQGNSVDMHHSSAYLPGPNNQ